MPKMNIDENGVYTSPSGSTYKYNEMKKTKRAWQDSKRDKLTLEIPVGVKQLWKALIPSSDKSLVVYISRLIEEDILRRISNNSITEIDIKNALYDYDAELQKKEEKYELNLEFCNLAKKLKELG